MVPVWGPIRVPRCGMLRPGEVPPQRHICLQLTDKVQPVGKFTRQAGSHYQTNRQTTCAVGQRFFRGPL